MRWYAGRTCRSNRISGIGTATRCPRLISLAAQLRGSSETPKRNLHSLETNGVLQHKIILLTALSPIRGQTLVPRCWRCWTGLVELHEHPNAVFPSYGASLVAFASQIFCQQDFARPE